MIEDGSSFKPAVLELVYLQEGVGLFGLEVYEETRGSLLKGKGGVVMALLVPVMMCGILYWAQRVISSFLRKYTIGTLFLHHHGIQSNNEYSL
jgi:hypothetical protein